MKFFLLSVIAALLLVNPLYAKTYDQNYGRDLKLPTQVLLEKQTVTDAEATDTDHVLTTNAGDSTGAGATVTSFTAQPSVPRVLTVTPTGTTADVAAGSVVITGTSINNDVITDTLAFLENASTATAGVVAFKTVTSISFPAEDSPYSATWTVGVNDYLGLKFCMDEAGDLAWTVADATFEGTRATCTADADEVEKNVCDPNTSPDGSKDFTFYFIQNYACQ